MQIHLTMRNREGKRDKQEQCIVDQEPYGDLPWQKSNKPMSPPNMIRNIVINRA